MQQAGLGAKSRRLVLHCSSSLWKSGGYTAGPDPQTLLQPVNPLNCRRGATALLLPQTKKKKAAATSKKKTTAQVSGSPRWVFTATCKVARSSRRGGSEVQSHRLGTCLPTGSCSQFGTHYTRLPPRLARSPSLGQDRSTAARGSWKQAGRGRKEGSARTQLVDTSGRTCPRVKCWLELKQLLFFLKVFAVCTYS